MIIKAEIIDQPYSGEYKEKIYDVSSPWNSQNWTWVKFVEDDYSEWCGEFRGSPRDFAISRKHNCVLVLTSDYLFLLDSSSKQLMEYESQPQYQNLTVTPAGDFLIADYYSISIIGASLKNKKPVASPIKMDMIKFGRWTGNKLTITCEEFLNWDNHVELEFDSGTLELTIKKSYKHYKDNCIKGVKRFNEKIKRCILHKRKFQ